MIIPTGSAVLGGGLVALAGTVLAVRSPARVAGALFALAGAAMAAAGWAVNQGVPGTPVAIATLQVAGLAVLAYPRLAVTDVATWIAAAVLVVLPPAALLGGPDTAAAAWLCVTLLPLTQVWWRMEGRRETRPLLWLLAASVTVILLGGLTVLIGSPWALIGFFPVTALVPLAAWIGLVRPQTVDVRGVVSAIVVAVTAGIGLLAAVVLISALWSGATGSEPTTAGVAVIAVVCSFLVEPARRQLRLVSDELLFGIRPDPLTTAGSLAGGIGGDPADALDAVRSALVLPYAALEVEDAPVVESGTPADHSVTLPLTLNGDRVGELVVGLRAGDLRLPAADATVLKVAGPLLAQTTRTHALAARLQEARELAATAREDERFRLRRDLHDGLGPRLAAIAFRVGAAQLKLAPDQRAVAEHLTRVRSETVAAIQEIRDLVYGMRPPALDEVGLVEAVRLRADELRTPAGDPMRIDLVADDLGDLPAAIEVAAYRIVVEALTNAARHSGGDRATARLIRTDGALVIEVENGGDARGPWRAGVGISSMRERAHELGGRITAGNGVVRAELPPG